MQATSNHFLLVTFLLVNYTNSFISSAPIENNPTQNKNIVSAKLTQKLDCNAQHAFSIYSDLSNHPKWCPSLKSVTYDKTDPTVSNWVLSVLKVKHTWEAKTTETNPDIESPSMRWKSISGVENTGHVVFFDNDLKNNCCKMTLSVKIRVPRLVAKVMPEDFVAKRLLTGSLVEFNRVASAASKK